MQKIKVNKGRVFASDRPWDAECFATSGDAVVFAKELYAGEFLDLPQGREGKSDPTKVKMPSRRACLGDFWPASKASEVAE
jgi:hypothetical protein